MASSRRPAALEGVGQRLVRDRQPGEPADRFPLLLDRGGPIAPVGVRERDLVADHPIVRLQSPGLAELGVRLMRLPEREEGRPERDVGEGVVGPEPGHLSEDVGGLRRLAALEQGLPQAASGPARCGA